VFLLRLEDFLGSSMSYSCYATFVLSLSLEAFLDVRCLRAARLQSCSY